MHNSAHAVDAQFKNALKNGQFPAAISHCDLSETSLNSEDCLDLFESQVMARHLDLMARELKGQSLSFYTIGSSGHEGNAAIAKAFTLNDMAFLHYRSAAFMIQRAKQLPGATPLYDFLLSFVASKEDPISSGRHKVFGSLELNVPPQTSTIASHLPKAVGAALSIHLAHRLKAATKLKPGTAVICSFGDASLNHSVTQGALQSVGWSVYHNLPMPLVLVCEDNQLGISVNTPPGWVKSSIASRPYLTYLECDGLNFLDVYVKASLAYKIVTQTQRPVFLHLKTVRLLGHAGSDVETEYLSTERIHYHEANDPLLHSARILIEQNIAHASTLLTIYDEIRTRIERIVPHVLQRPKLSTAEEVMNDLIPQVGTLSHRFDWPTHTSQANKDRLSQKTLCQDIASKKRETIFGNDWKLMARKHHMAKLINWTLRDLLLEYPNSLIFGEDVAQKGGVYHVTTGLWEAFGSSRVFNTLLDETTILGTAIGLAHNGLLPIPEIQFLAYLHNAEDQLRGEAATLSFFSSSQFTNPMVIRIAGLAYQKGFGGHFHNDNSFAVLRDIPGIIIACPSNGHDAVLMLRRCVYEAQQNRRVCVFLEPIALYMTKDLVSVGDKAWMHEYPATNTTAPLGQCAVHHSGKDLLIISYGNGHYLSMQAANDLMNQYKVAVTCCDLRWIAPLDEKGVITLAQKFTHILIVDECRQTGSLSEAIVTLLTEQLATHPTIKRICAQDSFIPLAGAAELMLPSRLDIVRTALEMIGVASNMRVI